MYCDGLGYCETECVLSTVAGAAAFRTLQSSQLFIYCRDERGVPEWPTVTDCEIITKWFWTGIVGAGRIQKSLLRNEMGYTLLTGTQPPWAMSFPVVQYLHAAPDYSQHCYSQCLSHHVTVMLNLNLEGILTCNIRH